MAGTAALSEALKELKEAFESKEILAKKLNTAQLELKKAQDAKAKADMNAERAHEEADRPVSEDAPVDHASFGDTPEEKEKEKKAQATANAKKTAAAAVVRKRQADLIAAEAAAAEKAALQKLDEQEATQAHEEFDAASNHWESIKKKSLKAGTARYLTAYAELREEQAKQLREVLHVVEAIDTADHAVSHIEAGSPDPKKGGKV